MGVNFHTKKTGDACSRVFAIQIFSANMLYLGPLVIGRAQCDRRHNREQGCQIVE
jgi:hypothetical protein